MFTRVPRHLKNSEDVQGAPCTCYAHACAFFLLMINANYAGTLPGCDLYMSFFHAGVHAHCEFCASETCNIGKYNSGDVIFFFFPADVKWGGGVLLKW